MSIVCFETAYMFQFAVVPSISIVHCVSFLLIQLIQNTCKYLCKAFEHFFPSSHFISLNATASKRNTSKENIKWILTCSFDCRSKEKTNEFNSYKHVGSTSLSKINRLERIMNIPQQILDKSYRLNVMKIWWCRWQFDSTNLPSHFSEGWLCLCCVLKLVNKQAYKSLSIDNKFVQDRL